MSSGSRRPRRRLVVTLPPHYCSSCHGFIEGDGATHGRIWITAERRHKVVAVHGRHVLGDASDPEKAATRIVAGILPRDFRLADEAGGEQVEWPVTLIDYETRVCAQCTSEHDLSTIDLTVLSNHEEQIRSVALDHIANWQAKGLLGEQPAPRTSLHTTNFTLAASWRPYLNGSAASIAWLTFSARFDPGQADLRWVLIPFHETQPDWSWLVVARLGDLRQHHLADLVRESQPSAVLGVGVRRPHGKPGEIVQRMVMWHQSQSQNPPVLDHLLADIDVGVLTKLAYSSHRQP